MDRRTVFCVVLAAMLFCAGGAGAQTGNGPVPERPKVLYAAGWEDNSGGYDIATVWKIDGSTVTPVALTDGTRDAGVYALAVSGGSLYAAGYERDSYDERVAMVWRIDGSRVTPVALTNGTRDAAVFGIVKSGGSLYAAGWDAKGFPTVWKIDGSRVTSIVLTGGSHLYAVIGILRHSNHER
jgi:hypothetical protein